MALARGMALLRAAAGGLRGPGRPLWARVRSRGGDVTRRVTSPSRRATSHGRGGEGRVWKGEGWATGRGGGAQATRAQCCPCCVTSRSDVAA